MLALRVKDLHLDEDIPYAWVTRSTVVGTDGHMVMNEQTKTGQDRRVDVMEPAKSALVGYLASRDLSDEDLAFPAPQTDGVFYGSYLRALVVKASEDCGFKRVVPYGRPAGGFFGPASELFGKY